MILLRLKVTNNHAEGNKPVQVTTAMLDVIPSPGGVRLVNILSSFFDRSRCSPDECLMQAATRAQPLWTAAGPFRRRPGHHRQS